MNAPGTAACIHFHLQTDFINVTL